MLRWWSARSPLVVAAVVVAVSVAVLLIRDASAEPSIAAGAAHLRADVTTMPNRQVGAYLRSHGVRRAALRIGGGTAVVAHLSWAPLRPARGARYEVFLAGGRCQPGRLDSYAGVPAGVGSLGFDSSWNTRLQHTPGLRADAEQRLEDGGFTSFAQTVSVPASYGGVWVVGQVLDACAVTSVDQPVPTVTDPRPVFGVGLTSPGHTWWLTTIR